MSPFALSGTQLVNRVISKIFLFETWAKTFLIARGQFWTSVCFSSNTLDRSVKYNFDKSSRKISLFGESTIYSSESTPFEGIMAMSSTRSFPQLVINRSKYFKDFSDNSNVRMVRRGGKKPNPVSLKAFSSLTDFK